MPPPIPGFDFMPALPEIALLASACVVLVADLFVPDARREISYWLTQLGLVVTAWLSLYPGHERAVQLAFFGYQLDLFHAVPIRTLGNMFVADALADVLTCFTCVSVVLTLAYSRTYLSARGLFRGETFVLTMFALLGMLVMISANSFITLYLGLELQSLSLYAMVALRRDSSTAVEASMKYFVLGALASGLLLYGMSMLYGATGSLDLGRVGA